MALEESNKVYTMPRVRGKCSTSIGNFAINKEQFKFRVRRLHSFSAHVYLFLFLHTYLRLEWFQNCCVRNVPNLHRSRYCDHLSQEDASRSVDRVAASRVSKQVVASLNFGWAKGRNRPGDFHFGCALPVTGGRQSRWNKKMANSKATN